MKKIISLILSAALLLCVLSGCSGSKNNTADNKEDTVSYNYTVDSNYSSVNASAVRAYEALCDAVVNGEGEALFNTALLPDVNMLFYTSFPLSHLVERLELNSSNSGVSIFYKYDMDTHFSFVSEFYEEVSKILTECGYPSVSNDVLMLNLYTYLCENILISTDSNSVYSVIMNTIGYSSSFAATYAYMLNQAGISAGVVNSTKSTGIDFMVRAYFDGDEYFFIPFYQARSENAGGLEFFALSLSEMNELGFTEIYYGNNQELFAVNAERVFEEFRQSKSYVINEGEALSVTQNNGEIVNVAL